MRINLQKYKISEVFIEDKKERIYDDIRKMNVLLTSEEIVRRRVIRFLIEEIKVPKYMLHVEVSLSYYHFDSERRADILILKKDEDHGVPIPLMVVECKAKNIILSTNNYEYYDQVLDYAYPLSCDYFLLTNGEESVIAAWDFDSEQYRDINCIPEYEKMLTNSHEWSCNKFKFEGRYYERNNRCL